MPYDKAERRWKIPTIDESGKPTGGWLDPKLSQAHSVQTWMSRPKADHFEVLYQLAHDRFAVLFRFSRSGEYRFTKRDYFQELSLSQAQKWFRREGHEIPPELQIARPAAPIQPAVILQDRTQALVRGIKKPINTAQYEVIEALIKARPTGLTKDGIERIRGDARGILRRLSRDKDWEAVIHMARVNSGRYRID